MKAKFINEWEGDFPGDTPADQGSRGAKQDNYRRMEDIDRVEVLKPTLVSLQGILANPEWFDSKFISEVTDMYMTIKDKITELETPKGEPAEADEGDWDSHMAHD
jgi:hypothetical protein